LDNLGIPKSLQGGVSGLPNTGTGNTFTTISPQSAIYLVLLMALLLISSALTLGRKKRK
jgi:LPXTG-motif cell wall-anchored protein